MDFDFVMVLTILLFLLSLGGYVYYRRLLVLWEEREADNRSTQAKDVFANRLKNAQKSSQNV
ncbi:hypothetical protein HPB58_18870 [Priestia filamentosa]|uniref:hypothetical protein n=1 Tax=Priestia TaxID=2800373 RepID=UPI001FB43146|nr:MULTISPECIES: hypothetical protein [Priestia]MCY8235418.1 hypothetical protein [Priestia endophytica]MED3727266.1 hypothetical protein [Priestia filamentosa]UOE59364.1 hypothetical protein HPB58_18870 [Priestia filamentosa]